MPDRKRIERNRTFIAIRIPDHLKKELVKTQRFLGEKSNVLEFIKPDDMHITLAFLGNLSVESQKIVLSLCQKIAPIIQPFSLHPTQLGAFPRINRPSVVWVGLGGETLILSELAYSLQDALKERKILPLSYKSDFAPHISIAKVARKERRGNLRSAREIIEQTILTLADVEIRITGIVVYQRNPLSHGPRYTTLARIPLGISTKSSSSAAVQHES